MFVVFFFGMHNLNVKLFSFKILFVCIFFTWSIYFHPSCVLFATEAARVVTLYRRALRHQTLRHPLPLKL